MNFKIIDKEKRGFARYCPTFARVIDQGKEALKRKRLAFNIRKVERLIETIEANVSDRKPTPKLSVIEALHSLLDLAEKGVSISPAVPTLFRLLSHDKDERTKEFAGMGLGHAADQGEDISFAFPALAGILGSGHHPSSNAGAAFALEKAAKAGADISCAVPALVSALPEDSGYIGDKCIGPALVQAILNPKSSSIAIRCIMNGFVSTESGVRFMVEDFLKFLTGRQSDYYSGNVIAGQIVRTEMTKAMIEVTQSKEFVEEMTKNSVTYTKTIGQLTSVLKWIEESEAKSGRRAA